MAEDKLLEELLKEDSKEEENAEDAEEIIETSEESKENVDDEDQDEDDEEEYDILKKLAPLNQNALSRSNVRFTSLRRIRTPKLEEDISSAEEIIESSNEEDDDEPAINQSTFYTDKEDESNSKMYNERSSEPSSISPGENPQYSETSQMRGYTPFQRNNNQTTEPTQRSNEQRRRLGLPTIDIPKFIHEPESKPYESKKDDDTGETYN